jgi:hypothetical protein
MAKVVKQFPMGSRVRSERHWAEKFMDGQIWQVELGQDVPSTSAEALRGSVTHNLLRKGLKAVVRKGEEEGLAYMQVVDLEGKPILGSVLNGDAPKRRGRPRKTAIG